jgi:glycosyltransferase involved in cell wall biosynthesis
VPQTTHDPSLPSISVVICAYTEARWSDLTEAIASVHGQRRPPLETVIVIDHNPDLRQRAERDLAGVTVVDNAEERGLSGARNSGIRATHGDVIAFMDDDAVAQPDWLEELGAVYGSNAVMAVGGSIVPMWLRPRPTWFPEEFDWVIGCTYLGMPTRSTIVRNVIGCNMSFRREVFDAVGGFSSDIGRLGTRPLGGEETEMCIRAQRRWPDRTIVYEPRAMVRHRVPANRGTLGYFRARCYAEGLSKATISRRLGANRALATERQYAVRTLGRGIVRNLVATVRERDPGGGRRAAAIIIGLATTSFGYLVGSARVTASGPTVARNR